MDRIRWTPAHHTLRRRLQRLTFSAAELRWLMTHAKGLPPELEQLIKAKLMEAEQKEGIDGTPQSLT